MLLTCYHSDAGLKPSSLLRTHGGIKGICEKLDVRPAWGFKTRDGHIVRSYYELMLDEYLFSRGIIHQIEVEPFPNKRYRSDQYLEKHDIHIEIWGLTDAAYVERRKCKEHLYEQFDLRLISIDGAKFQKSIASLEKYFDEVFGREGVNVIPQHSFAFDDISKQIGLPFMKETVVEEVKEFIEKHGEFPTQTSLKLHGIGDLIYRINMIGGFKYLREEMAYDPWSCESKWNSEEIIARLRAIRNQLHRFPKDQELPGDLRNAIRKSGHDMNYFRKLFDEPIAKQSNGHWTEDRVIAELSLFIEELGVFPTSRYLRSINRTDLDCAIQQYGYNHLRSKLGHPLLQESPGQHTNEALKEWLASVIVSHDGVPKQKDLRKIDSKKQGAIGNRGGVTPFLQQLAAEKPDVFEAHLVSFMSKNGGRRKKCLKKNFLVKTF